MKTLTHEGNEYHILHQDNEFPQITLAYRNISEDHIETLRVVTYSTGPQEIILHQMGNWMIKEILAHQEQLEEIETLEGQEELNHEHTEVLI